MNRSIFFVFTLASFALISVALPIVSRQELDALFPETSPEITPEVTLEPSLDVSPEPIFSTPQPVPDSEVTIEPEPEASVLKKEVPASPSPSTEQVTSTSIESGEMKPTPEPMNEGCVAIEHLDGYVLQHPQHLSRRVLCNDGFCATPNHAIIVDGVMTSMKRMCANKWQCVESVKLVNNLKISANRRAVFNDRIIITPYDFRFPKLASWFAQIVEDIYNILSSAAIAGVVLAFVAFATKNRKSSC